MHALLSAIIPAESGAGALGGIQLGASEEATMSLAPRGEDDKRPAEDPAEGRGGPPSAGEPAAEAGGGADDPGGGEEIHRPGDRVSAADELQAAGLAGPISLRAKPDSSNTISRTRIAGLSWGGLGEGIGL